MESKKKVYAHLRQRIITNALPPGKKLNEKELMREYQIGRTPLREIFFELQRDGLIEIIPKVGTLVSPNDIHEIREVVEVRRELEGLVGRLAAERITDDQLERLKRILEKVDQLKADGNQDLSLLSQYDADFHDTLYEAVRNRNLKEILHRLQRKMFRFWHHLGFDQTEFLQQFDDLRHLLEALEERDSRKAENILKAHIDHFVKRVRNRII